MEHISKTLENFPHTTGPLKKPSDNETIKPAEDIITACEEMKARRGYAPNPNCPVCRGFGCVNPLLPSGKTDYSRTISCEADGCIESLKRIYQGTEPYLKDKGVSKFTTFGTFKPVLGVETTLDAFRDIAFNPDAPPLLLVYGTTGNGKTHLCEATATELLKRGVDCRLWAVADLVSKLKESIPENTTELLIGKLKTLSALILDEWGQNYGSMWEEQKLEEIVIAREREGLITIVTTNLELEKLPERVISRFRDATQARIILNVASDFRPKKKARK